MLLNYPILHFGENDVLAYRAIIDAVGFSRPKLLDRMIAAQALAASAELATCNPRDFRDIPGLRLEDWSIATD
jgi:predicted nucleic acid-binding protein